MILPGKIVFVTGIGQKVRIASRRSLFDHAVLMATAIEFVNDGQLLTKRDDSAEQ